MLHDSPIASDAIQAFLRDLLGDTIASEVATLLSREAGDHSPPLDQAIAAALSSSRLASEYKKRHTLNVGRAGRIEPDYRYVGLEVPNQEPPFKELFESLFAKRLAKREDGFREIFYRLSHGGKSHPLIVETGCLRVPGNWAGDGQSTFMFDAFARAYRGSCISVDINLESVDSARRACSSYTTVALNDSVAFLHSLANMLPGKKIDLLYLDSFDVDANMPLPAAIHHVKELLSAWPMLGPGSIVCVDDFLAGDAGGKGGIIDDFFANVAATELFSAYQKAWIVG